MRLLCLILLLAGCASYTPPAFTVPVNIPISMPCAAEKITEPDWFIVSLPKNADVTAKLKAAFADLELSRGYIKELEAQLIACS